MPELIRLLGGLATPELRRETAPRLARVLGGDDLMLFAADPELGVRLPAPGLPQVLRGAPDWQRFLDACVREGTLTGTVPGPDGEPVPALGCALPDGTAAVLLGARDGSTGPEPLRPLLPLLGALFRTERQVSADEVRARAAADAAARGEVLTRALQTMRQRLEDALAAAEQARAHARQRAEQAERLAAELTIQANRLQEQAVELEALNDELLVRTEEAERARAAADEASHAKSEFLARMSHELRTPINAVIGYTDLLDLGITGPVTAEQQAQLARIRASSTHLLSLVNDVLDVAKVEAGRMSVNQQRERVAEVVAEATALVEGEAATRRLTLQNLCRDTEAAYVGDRDRVRQVLVNLLSNAVKFTEPGGRVVLRSGAADRPGPAAQVAGEGPWVYIAVEDTGIGMSPDQLRRVFQPFVQAQSGHTRTHGGTGLGLTISRQLARLMGGDLTVSSQPGVGSRFTLWLPVAYRDPDRLDPEALTVAAPEAGACPQGLTEVGAIVQAELATLTAAVARRVRAELPASGGDGEITDFVPVFLAELAGILRKLERTGEHPALLKDGSRVLRTIAEEHGSHCRDRGGTARALRREFEILREELVRTVRTVGRGPAEVDVQGVSNVVDRLIEVALYASLRSHGDTQGEAESRPEQA